MKGFAMAFVAKVYEILILALFLKMAGRLPQLSALPNYL